jgi:predicted DNA-binding protein (UPF0251 family)
VSQRIILWDEISVDIKRITKTCTCTHFQPQNTVPETSKTYRNPIMVAQEWQDAIREGTYSSQADLARRMGLSRAKVTQMLRLFKLSPKVLEGIKSLGDPLPSPIVTERMLRPLIELDERAQRQRLKILFGS